MKIKVKVEFYLIEDIDKQIKVSNLTNEQIREYKARKEEIDENYMKDVEESIRNEFEVGPYACIQDFKIRKIEDEN